MVQWLSEIAEIRKFDEFRNHYLSINSDQLMHTDKLVYYCTVDWNHESVDVEEIRRARGEVAVRCHVQVTEEGAARPSIH